MTIEENNKIILLKQKVTQGLWPKLKLNLTFFSYYFYVHTHHKGSCFYTFFCLSFWNPRIHSYFFEYYKHFSTCLWSVLKTKWTYFQHVLISSISENNSVSFDALKKHFLCFLPKHLFHGKLRWKCTGLFFEWIFLVYWCFLLVLSFCEGTGDLFRQANHWDLSWNL